jgi:hypothetical protein
VGEMTTDVSTTLNYDPKEDDKLLAEIREKVQSIPSSTPYLDAQKADSKAQHKADIARDKELAALGELGAAMVNDTAQETQSTEPTSN